MVLSWRTLKSRKKHRLFSFSIILGLYPILKKLTANTLMSCSTEFKTILLFKRELTF